jgi:hypothetical protein
MVIFVALDKYYLKNRGPERSGSDRHRDPSQPAPQISGRPKTTGYMRGAR